MRFRGSLNARLRVGSRFVLVEPIPANETTKLAVPATTVTVGTKLGAGGYGSLFTIQLSSDSDDYSELAALKVYHVSSAAGAHTVLTTAASVAAKDDKSGAGKSLFNFRDLATPLD